MVAKISIGASLHGALAYNGEKINEAKGRILAANKITIPADGHVKVSAMADNFRVFMPKTGRTKKPVLHISLNPHPDDILSDQQLESIGREYMERIGFAGQPWVMYKHEDIERHHIHIVTVNVSEEGKRLDQSFLFRRSKKATDALEEKYGLRKARREKLAPDTPITRVNPGGDLKRQVANTVKLVGMRWNFTTLGEYNAILGLYGIRCEQTDGRVNGREYHGLIYTALDAEGNPAAAPFKASRLGKFASRTAVEGRFARNREKTQLNAVRRKIAGIKAASTDVEDFSAKLRERGIDLVLRRTDEGRIYGAIFLDHETATAMNGSRIGKEYSANALQNWGEAPREEIRTPVHSVRDSKPTHTRQETPAQVLDHPFSFLPCFDGLFSVGPGYDPEEEAFDREMRRRKKKKRRGPQI